MINYFELPKRLKASAITYIKPQSNTVDDKTDVGHNFYQ